MKKSSSTVGGPCGEGPRVPATALAEIPAVSHVSEPSEPMLEGDVQAWSGFPADLRGAETNLPH